MRVDGRLTVMTTGGGLRAVMDELDERSGSAPLIALGPIAAGEARIAGLISGPSMHLSSRAGIVLTVNGRLCDVPEVRRAIQIAYADILPRHRFPHAIVSIEIPPERVDANIAPAGARRVQAAWRRSSGRFAQNCGRCWAVRHIWSVDTVR